MKGSHNSMSYMRPRLWWMRLINFTSKCQSKNYSKQIADGVRCFDIRMRRTNRGEWVFAHGLVEYSTNIEGINADTVTKSLICKLKRLSEPSAIRLIYETRGRKKRLPSTLDIIAFTDLCKTYQAMASASGNVKILGCRDKYTWTRLQELADADCELVERNIKQRYTVGSMTHTIGKLWPWLWNKINRKVVDNIMRARNSETEITLYDFV